MCHIHVVYTFNGEVAGMGNTEFSLRSVIISSVKNMKHDTGVEQIHGWSLRYIKSSFDNRRFMVIPLGSVVVPPVNVSKILKNSPSLKEISVGSSEGTLTAESKYSVRTPVTKSSSNASNSGRVTSERQEHNASKGA